MALASLLELSISFYFGALGFTLICASYSLRFVPKFLFSVGRNKSEYTCVKQWASSSGRCTVDSLLHVLFLVNSLRSSALNILPSDTICFC